MSVRQVVVTGIGINSTLGMNVQENLYSLRNQLCTIGTMSVLESKHKLELPVGEIKYSNRVLAGMTGMNEEFPRSVLLAAASIKECLSMSHIEGADLDGFYYGTTVGGIDQSEKQIPAYLGNGEVNYRIFTTHDNGTSADILCNAFNMSCVGVTVSTACSSAANAIAVGATDIKTGMANTVLVGGADALSQFTLNGFNSLMILDQQLCRPFDLNRQGLNLGEGSAFLLLESREYAIARGANILAVVSGWGNANDSHHQTASSPEGIGAKLSMEIAMQNAELNPTEITHINAHGTATVNNDESELNAMKSIFESLPPFTSTKSYTGHTLAASGGLEAVYSILSIMNDEMYPTLRFDLPIKESLSPVLSLTKNTVNHVLSNSFGFGGNCTSLIFSKYR